VAGDISETRREEHAIGPRGRTPFSRSAYIVVTINNPEKRVAVRSRSNETTNVTGGRVASNPERKNDV